MPTLERILATTVLQTLLTREHILVAEGSGEVLVEELEQLIAPTLPAITPHLTPQMVLTGEVTSSFGAESADEAIEELVEAIGELLMESDHVDDIFAEDRLIRRDAFRALADVLSRYVAGEIEADDESAEDTGLRVELDTLGYVVSSVGQRADEATLVDALSRAALAVDGELVSFDAAERTAVFQLEEPELRLALEETITEEIVELVDADLVELPSIEQIFQVPRQTAMQDGFEGALLAAARQTQRRTGCGAACTIVDQTTLLATLTPLSEEGAQRAEAHFATFLEMLERALAALRNGAEPPAEPDSGGGHDPDDGSDPSGSASPDDETEPSGAAPVVGTRAAATARKPRRVTRHDNHAGRVPRGPATARKTSPAPPSDNPSGPKRRVRRASGQRSVAGAVHDRGVLPIPAAAMLAAADQAGRVKRRG